jgi:hypothetical protein
VLAPLDASHIFFVIIQNLHDNKRVGEDGRAISCSVCLSVVSKQARARSPANFYEKRKEAHLTRKLSPR